MADWSTTHIGEIEDVAGWVPVRRQLGIEAFGINAWLTRCDGTVIVPHDEIPTGHEEVYFVVKGHATFVLDDQEMEARAGSIVHVPNPETHRSARGEPGTVVLAVGAPSGRGFTVSAWEAGAAAFAAYSAGDLEEALAGWETAIGTYPDRANFRYNAACAAALLGRPDQALARLGEALELDPSLKPEEDEDFANVKDTPEFKELVDRSRFERAAPASH